MSKSILSSVVLSIALSVSSFNTLAQLTLDKAQSTVNFISTKNEHVSETHTFNNFSGELSEQGKLTITIDIASVETLVPIRNERMQKMLFNMSDYSSATFTAQVDPALTKLEAGEMQRVTVAGEMMIAGNKAPISFEVMLTGLKDGGINATTATPTILSASEFNLDEGVAALQKVANLKSISKSVPLSFSATFSR